MHHTVARTVLLTSLLLTTCCAHPQLRQSLSSTRSARNTISFDTQVDDDTVEAAVALIDAANARGAASITIELNTPGGAIDAGLRLVKAIEHSRAPVTCRVDGMAASMGFYILQACHTRQMTSRSVLMSHAASMGGMFGGQAQDWQNVADRLRAMDDAAARFECRRLTLPFDECRAHTSGGREWWMSAAEALAVGAVDSIISP